MKKNIKMPIEAFENWLRTGQGKRVLLSFLNNQGKEYKRNCLWWAFQAGAASNEISATREVAAIFDELKGRKVIPKHLQRRIGYVLEHKDDYTMHELNKTPQP
jgi:hypothetical protein